MQRVDLAVNIKLVLVADLVKIVESIDAAGYSALRPDSTIRHTHGEI